MKMYIVKIKTSDSIEEIYFKNYIKARQFAEEIDYGTVTIVENKYYSSEKIR